MTTVAQRTITDEIRRAVQDAHIPVSQLAAATGADPSTARRWLQAKRSPAGDHERRSLEFVALLDRLLRIMNAEFIPVWLAKPIPLLDDRRPVDALAAGDYREASKLIGTLEGTPFI